MNHDDRQLLIGRSVFREANDAFFLFDPRTQVVLDLNPAAMRLTGLERRAACSLSLGDLFYSSGPGGLDQLAVALSRTGFFHSREGFFLRRPSKEDLAVNISVSRIHTEPEPVGLVVARDISDRKRAEDSLKRIQARYDSLVASTGVVVWELDRDRTLVSLSPRFETLTGWPGKEWIGRRVDELVHPDDLPVLSRLDARPSQDEHLTNPELRVRTRNGDYLDCEPLLITSIREGRGDRTLCVTRDVTERKRAALALEQAEAMRRAKEAAEQASRSKSEFLSNVSHELRTPLTAILGFSELACEHPQVHEGPPELARYLETIRDNGRVLLALIDDLLDISSIESGQLRVESEAVSVSRIVAHLSESFRARAEAKGLRFEVDHQVEVPATIATDRLRLQQVLANLLDNAIKFTDWGTVRLAATVAHPAGSGPEGVLRFEVGDTGVGIPAEAIGGLFQPFHRVHAHVAGGPEGTGLGLAISRRLAERLGGEIGVQSAPGVGTTFTVTIPVRRAEAEVRLPEAEPPPEPSKAGEATPRWPRVQARVLLAEDNDANRHVIGLRLAEAGAEVVTARNGKEAIDRIDEAIRKGRPIEAVVMDMEMPILDGYEAVRQIRARGYSAPIIAVTAYAMREDRDECLAIGCDAHISKPVEWDRLFLSLSGLLEGARTAAGAGETEDRTRLRGDSQD
jgi:PAS domain S-box-containing protein